AVVEEGIVMGGGYMLLRLAAKVNKLSIRLSTTGGVRELLNASNTLPLVLNTDSEATVEMGIARTSLTSKDSMGNLGLLTFH
ncbi:hypothetical protein Tco_1286768, partial [Tanacetum coccineum]